MENTLKPECAGVWNHLGKVFGKIAPPPQTVSCTKALMCASVWTVRSRAKPRPVILKAMRKSLHKTSIDHPPKKKSNGESEKQESKNLSKAAWDNFFFFWFIKKKNQRNKKICPRLLGINSFFFLIYEKKNRRNQRICPRLLGGLSTDHHHRHLKRASEK